MPRPPSDPEFLREAGARLKLARELAGLTQAEVAEQLGIGREQTIGDIEQGQNCNMTRLALLCSHYKVSVDWVLGLSMLPDVKLAGGIINLAVERAVAASRTYKEAHRHARQLGAILPDGTITLGFELPLEAQAVTPESWNARRAAFMTTLKELHDESG